MCKQILEFSLSRFKSNFCKSIILPGGKYANYAPMESYSTNTDQDQGAMTPQWGSSMSAQGSSIGPQAFPPGYQQQNMPSASTQQYNNSQQGSWSNQGNFNSSSSFQQNSMGMNQSKANSGFGTQNSMSMQGQGYWQTPVSMHGSMMTQNAGTGSQTSNQSQQFVSMNTIGTGQVGAGYQSNWGQEQNQPGMSMQTGYDGYGYNQTGYQQQYAPNQFNNNQQTGNYYQTDQGNQNLNNQPQKQKKKQPPKKNANMNEQMNEFYASIDPDLSEGPHSLEMNQSSIVSSSTEQPRNSLQQSIGQKLQEISNQMSQKKGANNFSQNENSTNKSNTRMVNSSLDVPYEVGWKISDEFADEDTEYCKLCNMYFTSPYVSTS